MTPERAAAEEVAAIEYATLIGNLGPIEGWPAYNRSIIRRWSLTALNRIKRRAWYIVESERKLPRSGALPADLR